MGSHIFGISGIRKFWLTWEDSRLIMVRAVVSKFNSGLALKFIHEITLNINDLH